MQWKSQKQTIKSDIDLGYGLGIWAWNTDLEYGIKWEFTGTIRDWASRRAHVDSSKLRHSRTHMNATATWEKKSFLLGNRVVL